MSNAKDMFSDSSDDEGEKTVKLTINEHYAKAFQHRKEREEYEQLKLKYGSDFDENDLEESTDSESAESEDEDGEELTPAVDAAILRTLARIRKKDPAIYNSEKNIFGEETQKVSTNAPTKTRVKKDKSKPITVRQQNIDAVLRGSRSPSPEPALPTHVQEQEALRDETIRAFHNAVPDDDSDDDILVLREKTKDELAVEEEEYKAYLERNVGEDLKTLVTFDEPADEAGSQGDNEEEGDKKKDKKKRKKSKEKKKAKRAEEDQEFLLNYILNRGWIDSSAQRIPTYHEITGDGRVRHNGKGKEKEVVSSSSSEGENEENDDGALSDASFESLASQFEVSYNHRFEEPEAAVIPSFPRQIESTVRRGESTRKDARERKKARKEAEIQEKKEEVRRLKALKVKEIKRKLEKIGMESGLLKGKKGKKNGQEEEEGDVDAALADLDLEGDWDPEKHDRQLKELFDNAEEGEGEGGGYGEEEGEERYDEDGKPVWDNDIDIGNIYMSDDEVYETKKSKKELKKEKKKKKKKNKGGDDDEDEGVDIDAMDADKIAENVNNEDEEEWDGTEEMRKRKWKEYMDSLYELDFNDVVGGMKTRFSYAPVPKQTYSLDPVEILLASDKELNEYMSVKKIAPYRHDRGTDRSRWDPRQQEKLKELKENLKKRQMAFGIYDANGGGASGGGVSHRDKGWKNKKEGAADGSAGAEAPKKKRMGKKERMKLKAAGGESEGEGAPGDAMEVDTPSVSHKKEKRKHEDDEAMDVDPATPQKESKVAEDGPKRKKRRRRAKKDGATDDS